MRFAIKLVLTGRIIYLYCWRRYKIQILHHLEIPRLVSLRLITKYECYITSAGCELEDLCGYLPLDVHNKVTLSVH